MNIELVPVQAIDQVWPLISGMVVHCLQKAPGETSAGELWAGCRSGGLFLFKAETKAGIQGVSIWRFSGHGYFECVVCCGKRADDWFPPMYRMALGIARANGCKGAGGNGRAGFVRLLKKHFPEAKIMRQTFIVSVQ